MSPIHSKDKWFIRPQPRDHATLRLFCIPYAGGNANTYLSWASELPAEIELVAIQPPGRSTRMDETPYHSMGDLTGQLATQFEQWNDKPFVMLGHSLGSRIGFELLHQLESKKGIYAAHFIASGSKAPHLPMSEQHSYNLSDDRFIEKLRSLNGTPEEVLQNKSLLACYLPMLRADFEVLDTYKADIKSKIHCPISVFFGKQDSSSGLKELLAWKHHCLTDVDRVMFSGGHFYIEEDSHPVIEEVNKILRSLLVKSNL